ncbi:YhcN/YlaJ family sporulation lipoprotein [Lederbergia panacisoli]|uniref:YhcN/YlaJ family sporulation lipoprotein n=1 Tax=Lederbergia panacisoli TaxID=1255251 RepID=UPI00214BF1BB|nr:YhcN/YlaJ family sporulation lipoprotein [Lederbergia panacisoli]MCR2823125.1 YhcN/YlaJ family sporulation lipoprotein [Lederbergia panacisoli]
MKYKSIPIIFISTMLVGCGVNDKRNAEDNHVYHNSGNSINVAEHGENFNSNQQEEDLFGFVRQVKSPINGGEAAKPIKGINKEQTADNIGKILVLLPGVEDASVLVTDQEVLVAYKTNEKRDSERFEIADQVKKTAISVVPRFYHVYITDDPTLRQNIENIASMNARSSNKDKTVRDTVNLMLKRSPQGRKMNDGENPNGEAIGDQNHHLERSNYRQQFENKK